MSKSAVKKKQAPLPAPTPTVDAAGVRRYLSRHPEFFQDHQYLLTTLSIPHPVKPAISLIERQVELLREQNEQLQQQTAEQISIARDNEHLNDRMRELCLLLFGTSNLNQRLKILRSHLLQDLTATAVSVRFFCPENTMTQAGLKADLHTNINDPNFRKHFSTFLKKPNPLCGRLSSGQRHFLFGEQANLIESGVLVPLKAFKGSDAPIGLLAIGSDSADRFQPDMGTTFLRHLGELVGQALGVCLEKTQ